MLVLVAGERILFQHDANLTLRYKSMKGKQDGRGILYITNMRIVFEDHRQGILMQVFPHLYELQAYRRVRGLLTEKLALDIEKSNSSQPAITATAELEFKDKRAIAEAEYTLNTLLSNSSSNNSNTNVQYISEDNSKKSNNLTASRSPLSFSTYSIDMSTSSNTVEEKEEKRMPEEYKKWISDIKFTWDPDKRLTELGYIGNYRVYDWEYFSMALTDIDSTLEYMKSYFDTSRFSPDFRYKVAREVYKLRAVNPAERDLKKRDTNVYWVGIIENAYRDGSSELVGVNINGYAGESFYILNPIHWQHRFRSWVRNWYDTENDEPASTFYVSEKDKEFCITLANACKDFYYGILNRDFRKAEEAHKTLSETYKKYSTAIRYVTETGEYGLILKYAMEMHVRNIPFSMFTKEKNTPV